MVVVPPLVYPVPQFVVLVRYVLQTNPEVSGIRVRSWLRTPQRQAELVEFEGGAVRSLHTRGLALDLVGTPVQLGAMARGWVALGLDALAESDHLHIELDGPALRRLGLDFRV